MMVGEITASDRYYIKVILREGRHSDTSKKEKFSLLTENPNLLTLSSEGS